MLEILRSELVEKMLRSSCWGCGVKPFDVSQLLIKLKIGCSTDKRDASWISTISQDALPVVRNITKLHQKTWNAPKFRIKHSSSIAPPLSVEIDDQNVGFRVDAPRNSSIDIAGIRGIASNWKQFHYSFENNMERKIFAWIKDLPTFGITPFACCIDQRMTNERIILKGQELDIY